MHFAIPFRNDRQLFYNFIPRKIYIQAHCARNATHNIRYSKMFIMFIILWRYVQCALLYAATWSYCMFLTYTCFAEGGRWFHTFILYAKLRSWKWWIQLEPIYTHKPLVTTRLIIYIRFFPLAICLCFSFSLINILYIYIALD